MRRDWLLVGSDISLRAEVLGHWLRGRQPAMTQEHIQQRWCHKDALYSLPDRGRAGAAHHPLDSHAPSATAAMTLFSFFLLWKKAYMSIDANDISTP